MDRQSFMKLLAKRLYPTLRGEGFVGSGSTLRRVAGLLVHVFNVQGSRDGNQCYLNLGAHLTFLPPEGGLPVATEALEESHCIFRGRIHPPAGISFGWGYGSSAEEAEDTIQGIEAEWALQGHAFFDRYAVYPQSFEALLANTVPATVHARTHLHLARIAAQLDRPEDARRFAQAGLESAAERATGLRSDLADVLKSVGAD